MSFRDLWVRTDRNECLGKRGLRDYSGVIAKGGPSETKRARQRDGLRLNSETELSREAQSFVCACCNQMGKKQ